jgi:ERCC4-type nuclease
MIRNLYALFQKPWSEHKAMSRPDLTKIQHVNYDLELLKVEPHEADYPQYWLRKALFQVQGVSWEQADVLTKQVGTMKAAMELSQKEWEAFEGIGKIVADRLYRVLHGYSDPTVKKRKRRGENELLQPDQQISVQS